MVIDAHTHIYPPKIAEKAVGYIGEFYGLDMRGGTTPLGGTAENLIERGKIGGIDRFLVLAVSQTAEQVQRINDFTAATVAANPELIGFGTLHRDMENPLEEVERIPALGLKGVKIHPDMQRFFIDDDALFPVYDLLAQKGLPILLHTGDYRHPWSHPERMARVIKAFPKLTVIAAHFGGWSLFDLALEYLLQSGCYVDTSSSLPLLGGKRFAELINLYGAERVLFGSDYPMWDPGEELKAFLSVGLPAKDQDLILSGNLLGILG
ncbi:amidohydrolase [Clostridia bacterium]|nr:amidohydrolase [Clostridia bacterium]